MCFEAHILKIPVHAQLQVNGKCTLNYFDHFICMVNDRIDFHTLPLLLFWKVPIPSPQYKSIDQILLKFIQSLFSQSLGNVKSQNIID